MATNKKSVKKGSSEELDVADLGISEIKKLARDSFGDELIKTLDERPKKNVRGLSWGSPSINYACTGNPFVGLVKGRIYEIFGAESSGKTTLCLHAVAEAQKLNVSTAFIDAEQALDVDYAESLGVQKKELIFVQPDYGEQALDVVEKLLSLGVRLIVVDSVAALVPLAEIEAEMEKAHIGLHARMMSKCMRKLTPRVNKSDSTLIFINQTRFKIGELFGDPTTTPGGQALKFSASFRLKTHISTAKSKAITGATATLTGKKENERLGSNMCIKLVKNKLHTPYKQCEVPLYYGLGLDLIGDWYMFAVGMELIKKGRGAYIIPGIGKKKDLRIGYEEMHKNVDHIRSLIETKFSKFALE